MKKIIIVGSGIAGLSAGIYGLLNEYNVEIYEKNHEAGGFLTSWYRKNTLIDGCLHWMIGTKDGTNLNKVWKTIGGLDGVEIYHPNSFYEVRYDDKTLTLYQDIDKLKESLLNVSENDDNEINDLIEAIKVMGVVELPTDAPYELACANSFKPNMAFLKKIAKYLKITVEELANRFNSKIIRFSLENSIVDKGFSAFYLIQTLSNFVLGNASLPNGGSHGLRDRLVKKYESLGGKIKYNANVDEIIIENGKAIGIILSSGEKHYSDYVISSGDVHHTFNNLLKNKYEMNPYIDMDNNKKKYPTYSFVIAIFKTKHNFKNEEIAQVHKVKEYSILNKEYNHLSMRHYGYEDEFINDGYTPVQVMLTTYEDDYEYIKSLSKDDYKKFKEEFGKLYKNMLEEIYGSEFELIDVLTPLTYERYVNAYKGGFMTYLLLPRINQVIRSAKVEGLDNFVLANQWLMLPGGTPVAVVQGKFAIQLILNMDNRDYNID